MRFSQVSSLGRPKLLKWLERLTANAKVATILGSIPASSDTVESKGQPNEAVVNKVHTKNESIFICLG
jgi:hypothetical protein